MSAVKKVRQNLKLLTTDPFNGKSEAYTYYLMDEPADPDEALDKWNNLSKALQMVQVLYRIPNEKIEQLIALAERKL